jgi:hypothetical protein
LLRLCPCAGANSALLQFARSSHSSVRASLSHALRQEVVDLGLDPANGLLSELDGLWEATSRCHLVDRGPSEFHALHDLSQAYDLYSARGLFDLLAHE